MAFEFDRVYWVFIAAAAFFHIIAVACTYFALTRLDGIRECSTAMSSVMDKIGIIPAGILTTVAGIGVMFLLPVACGKTKKISVVIAIALFLSVVVCALDALNDIFVISGNDLGYLTTGILKPIMALIGIGGAC